jgi:hypothetical protein
MAEAATFKTLRVELSSAFASHASQAETFVVQDGKLRPSVAWLLEIMTNQSFTIRMATSSVIRRMSAV